MKRYILLIALIIGFLSLYSQAPNKLSYQIEVTDNDDQLITNQQINVKISILESSIDGSVIFTENHIVTTDYTGLANIEIGNGQQLTGKFAAIDWSKGPFFIKTEVDPEGGINFMTKGVSELLSVPYSLYSKTAEKVINASYNDLNDKPVGVNKGDILYWNGEGWAIIPIGYPGQWLQINQEGVPFWADAYQEDASRSVPIVGTTPASSITSNTAVSGGYLRDACTYFGVCYNTYGSPSLYDTHTTQGNGISTEGVFTSNLTNLQPNTTYYLKAYGTNSNQETGYGSQVTFTTSKGAPVVTTTNVNSITATSAVSGGIITNTGGGTITYRGVCWSTSPNPTTSNNCVTIYDVTSPFICTMTNLTLNTTYYVRAWALTSYGLGYGDQKIFSTNLPQCSITTVSNVTCNSAGVAGYIGTQGGSAITERGYCYGTTSLPTISGSHVNTGSGTGTVSATLPNLASSTLYYVRMYAINSIGISYGAVSTFTTTNIQPPVVTTNEISSIKATTSVSGGNVSGGCGTTIIARGVCWSLGGNPTINDNKTVDGNAYGNFTSNLTGLILNRTYYVRAYVTTSNFGTIYGSEKSFLTRLNIGDDWEGGKVFKIENVVFGLVAAPTDLSGNYTWDNAKTACESLVLNGKSDWYLPNLTELNILYDEKDLVGNFINEDYWSSATVTGDPNSAQARSFFNGFSYTHLKTELLPVRAIRAF